MFITNRYTMIYIPIFVNIVLLLLFGYRYLFFSLCLWMNWLETTLPSFAIHCNRHGNVITDATLER